MTSPFLSAGDEPRACPDCPLCGHPPGLVLVGDVQAFCGNDACRVMCWNPSRTRAENLDDIGECTWEER
jgi:hypothetical protein